MVLLISTICKRNYELSFDINMYLIFLRLTSFADSSKLSDDEMSM